MCRVPLWRLRSLSRRSIPRHVRGDEGIGVGDLLKEATARHMIGVQRRIQSTRPPP